MVPPTPPTPPVPHAPPVPNIRDLTPGEAKLFRGVDEKIAIYIDAERKRDEAKTNLFHRTGRARDAHAAYEEAKKKAKELHAEKDKADLAWHEAEKNLINARREAREAQEMWVSKGGVYEACEGGGGVHGYEVQPKKYVNTKTGGSQ